MRGRSSPVHTEQGTRWITASQQGFYDFTPTAGDYRHGIPRWSKSWQLSGNLGKNGALYTVAEITGELDVAAEIPFDDGSLGADRTPPTTKRRLLGHTRHRYWNNDADTALEYGDIESRALPYETYALALTSTMLSQGGPLDGIVTTTVARQEGLYKLPSDIDVDGFEATPPTEHAEDTIASDGLWASTGHATFDASSFYLVTAVTDVFGTSTNVTYDSEKLFVTATTLNLSSPLNLSTTAEIDYRVLGPKKVTGIDGSHSRARFDALGRVLETAVAGAAGEGDTLSTDSGSNGPTTEITYSAFDWLNQQKPTWVKTRVREKHDDPNTAWIESYAYANGSGAVVLTKVQAEDGPAPNFINGQVELDENGDPVLDPDTSPRWLGSGRTVVDNKGNPIKQYEPYFSNTHLYDEDEVFHDWGVTPLLHYDPLGRLIRTDLPDGSTSRVEFSPWFQKTYDQNDTVGEPGNLWYAEKKADSDPYWQDAADKAVAHSYNDGVALLDPGDPGAWGTPTVTHFDALGRAYAVVEHNRAGSPLADVLYTTRSLMDVQGNVLSVKDAKSRDCMLYEHGILGQVLRLTSLDAGRRYMFDAVNGQPVRMWAERGFTQRVTYDALRRPLAVYVDDGTTEVLVQRLLYGEYHTDAATKYLKGRVVQHYDQSGVVLTEDFDFKGNPKSTSRRLANTYQSTVDWSAIAIETNPATAISTAGSQLESKTWTHTFVYDALNRPTSVKVPDNVASPTDNTEIIPTYNKAGLLDRVTAKVRGATTATVFVDDIAYDEKGRRTKIVYSDTTGNHFFTEYIYDPLTYRLEHFKTKRTSDDKLLQSLAYYYDPVGNITATKDTSSHEVFFSGGGSIPEADGDYTYDAIYRLIAASGREHADFGGYTDEQDDALAHPQASTSLREYDEEYVYDEVGNLLSMHHQPIGGGTAWTRGYTYVTHGSGHDDFPNVESNRLATTHDSGNPPVSRSYGHDAHGNMVDMPHLFDLQWDYADQLKYVEIVENNNQEAFFVYDASGTRVRKVWIHGQYRDETLYLGGMEIFRRFDNGTKTLERETVHVSDDARRICMIETQTVGGSGTRYRFQLDDHLGTVAVEVTETGDVISYEQYHPYGTSAYRAQDGTLGVSAKRYRYNGKERDDETKLYYYGARYYAPWLGRWTAADPLWGADGPNLYQYVRGSPIVLSDPNGMQSVDESKLAETPTSSWKNASVSGTASAGTKVYGKANVAASPPSGGNQGGSGSSAGTVPEYTPEPITYASPAHEELAMAGLPATPENLALVRQLQDPEQKAAMKRQMLVQPELKEERGQPRIGRYVEPKIRTVVIEHEGKEHYLTEGRYNTLAFLSGAPPLPREVDQPVGPPPQVSAQRDSGPREEPPIAGPRVHPITVYRVQAEVNERIVIGPNGEVSFSGSGMLYVNIDNEERARQYLRDKRSGGLTDAVIAEFQIPSDLHTEIHDRSVHYTLGKRFRRYQAPHRVDTRYPRQYGLHRVDAARIQGAAIQGSGRVRR